MDDPETRFVREEIFELPQVTGTYDEARIRQQYQYTQDIATGRFKPEVGPWSSLDFIIFVVTIYTAAVRAPPLEWITLLVITTASVWSLLYYRSPGIGGASVLGSNACMVMLLVANFAAIRDVRNIQRAYGVTTQSEANNEEPDLQKWQPISNHPWLRFWFAMDLIACMRALRWSWNSQGLSSEIVSKSSRRRSGFYKRQLVRFVGGYLGLDIIKCIMIADPYFYGFIDCQAPSAVQSLPQVLVHAYRILLAAAGVACAVQCYGSAWTAFKAGVLGLLKPLLGMADEPRMDLTLFGSPMPILKHDLKGFRNHTWHRVFRSIENFVTLSPSQESCSWPRVDPRAIARMSTVFAVFMTVHICAFYTQFGPSWHDGSFFAFGVQPVGVLLQAGLSELMHQTGQRLTDRALVGGYASLTFCVIWLMVACIPLINDFSVGGLWTFEPVPISFTRGLGMSSQDRTWFPWTGSVVTADI